MLIAFLDADVVVSPADVELREPSFAFELIDDVISLGQRVVVAFHDSIEFPVVLDGAELSVLLFDEEEWTHNG